MLKSRGLFDTQMNGLLQQNFDNLHACAPRNQLPLKTLKCRVIHFKYNGTAYYTLRSTCPNKLTQEQDCGSFLSVSLHPNPIEFANEAKLTNAYKLGSRRWNDRANLGDYTYLMSPNKGENVRQLSGISPSSNTSYKLLNYNSVFTAVFQST